MTRKNKFELTGEVCFWLALATELIIVMIDKSAYTNPLEGQLFRLTFLLCCIKIAATRYTREEWLCMAVFFMIAFISYLVNTRDEAVRVVAFVAACKGVDLKKMLKLSLAVTLIGAIILFALSVLGIFGAVSVTTDFGHGGVETRYCFGMGHPNAFQCMLLMMTSLAAYIYAERMKLYHFALLVFVNYVAYVYTDSNTGFIVCTAVILGIMLLKYAKPLRELKVIYILGALSVIAMVAFSAYGSHVGRGTEFMYKLDALLNGRFQYSQVIENARIENWLPFASPENTEYFDAGFIRLFYWYGIIPGIIYVLMNLYLIYQSYKSKDYALVVIVVGYALYTVIEAHLISVYILRNYLFVIMGYYWYQPFKDKGRLEGHFWQVRKILKGDIAT